MICDKRTSPVSKPLAQSKDKEKDLRPQFRLSPHLSFNIGYLGFHTILVWLENKIINFLLCLSTESDSQFPPAGEPVRVVSSAADEDEARGNQGADPEDPRATRTGQEGARPGQGSARLS